MRRLPAALWLVLILGLVVASVAGCGPAAPGEEPPSPPPGTGSPGGSGGTGGTGGTGQPPAGGPSGIPSSPPANFQVPAALADARLTPLGPGVYATGALAARDVQVRALVEYQSTTFEPASATLELNGVALSAYALRYKGDEGVDGRRLLIGAPVSGLLDGKYRATLRVGGKDGRVAGAFWEFSIAAGGAAPGGAAPGGAAPGATGTTLTLYFADGPLVTVGFDGEYNLVTPVKRVVPKTVAPARAAIDELIAGPRPEDGEVGRTVPATSLVKGLTIRDGVAKLDLSPEFARDHPGGTTGGAITVQSIIYTLTEFPTVQSVQVLVNGEPWSDGHFIWTEPWLRPTAQVERFTLPPVPVN